jgi:hypothetical protein
MLTCIKASKCPNRACDRRRQKKSQKRGETPGKIPAIPAAKNAKNDPSVNDEPQVDDVDTLRKSLISPSSSGALKAPPQPTTDCDKCENGYIAQGRPYFVLALWDFNCDDFDRMVNVPTQLALDTPKYVAPSSKCFSPGGNLPGYFGAGGGGAQPEVYWANPVPHWTPEADDDEDFMDLDDDLDDLPESLRNTAAAAVPMTKMSLRDLIFFGDALAPTGADDAQQAWDLVRKLHNSLRLCSIRMPPR